jgi:DNA-binding transcriptional LysR family regulator
MKPISQSFRCFDEVAKRGSIRKAAETLHLTPSAVNQQILNLEAEVGVPLFDRFPKGMRLTAAGEIVITAVRRGQREYDSALTQVDAMRTKKRGHVKLGVSLSSAEGLLPAVLEAAMAHYPGISYSVSTGSSDAIVGWVASGQVDVGFCLRHDVPNGVEEKQRWAMQLGLVTHPEHDYASRKAVAFRDCADLPVVLGMAPMTLRLMIDGISKKAVKATPKPLIETTSFGLMRSLVLRNVAVAFATSVDVAADVAEGRLAWVPLTDAGAATESCIYGRAGQATPVAVGIFIELLDKALRTSGAAALAVGNADA